MTAASELWDAVEASYDADGLVSLTNIRDRAATSISTTAGENAAQGVIDLWPAYAQEVYDEDNALHVEVGKRATIAMLWQRGGSSTSIAKVEWDEVFSSDGLISKVRNTGARGRQGPSTNSGVLTSPETVSGRQVMGWSDRGAVPHGLLPNQRIANPGL